MHQHQHHMRMAVHEDRSVTLTCTTPGCLWRLESRRPVTAKQLLDLQAEAVEVVDDGR